MIRKTAYAALGGFLALLPAVAGADTVTDPQPWQMNMQPAGSAIMDRIEAFHSELIYIITAISLFVLGLLIYVMIRYNAKRNPTPTRTAHNTVLEVLWTVIPIIILVFIAIPSFKLLFFSGRIPPDAQMTLKVTGHQWFWTYDYPDQGGIHFDSLIKCRTESDCASEAKAGGPPPVRLLTVDNPVVVPVGEIIRVQIVSDDVIHSWAVPSLGIKTDAVPGRLQETWMKVEHPGTFYGQCSELCGIDHGFMPIEIKAVSKADFEKWVQEAKTKFSAHNDSGPAAREVAQVQSR